MSAAHARGAVLAWATKRARYGPTGVSPATRQRARITFLHTLRVHGHHMSKRTHCRKRHHPLSGGNVRWILRKSGWVRECRACRAEAKARAK